jgi:hypothetical protein
MLNATSLAVPARQGQPPYNACFASRKASHCRRSHLLILSQGGPPPLQVSTVDMPSTLALLATGLALTAFSRWYETWPRPLGEVRLLPSTALLAAGVLVSVLAAAHLVSLLTGTPLTGRAGF